MKAYFSIIGGATPYMECKTAGPQRMGTILDSLFVSAALHSSDRWEGDIKQNMQHRTCVSKPKGSLTGREGKCYTVTHKGRLYIAKILNGQKHPKGNLFFP